MAEIVKLSLEERNETGKGVNRRMRAAGMTPAVFYDQKGLNIPVKVKTADLEKVLRDNGTLKMIEVEIDREGKVETAPAMIWRIKREPIRSYVEHVDFFGVDLEKPIAVKVPLKIVGRSKGVQMGAKLDFFREIATLECKPADIPTVITIDVTEYMAGDELRISGLQLPEGVKAVYKDDFKIVSVHKKGAKDVAAEAED